MTRRRVAAFVAKQWGVPRQAFQIDVQSMHGGLESMVACARIVPRSRASEHLPSQLVIKALPPGQRREASVYETLWRYMDRPPTVRVLGRETAGSTTYLFLEHAERVSSWPWSHTEHAAAVCREIARLHDRRELPADTFAWDYEPQLSFSAAATLATAQQARDASDQRCWRRYGDLARVVRALPRIRALLLSGEKTVLHGDVHPGNVILCARRPHMTVVFVDWSRARVGSPLEDLASWLHALGCWEPEARRRHDTLVRAYLRARATPLAFSPELRACYWFASASNGLAGAIQYHLAVLGDSATTPSARDDSQRALVAWQRVIRRAAALLRTRPVR
jgi:aminoglycoside phosphotransferase (APT) family kinase protein